MRSSQKLLIGALAGAGLAWGTKLALRARRRIELEDRVVVLTGASTGHGLIAARIAAERGAKLVLAARDSKTLFAAEDELARAGARHVSAVPTDVTDPEQCHLLIEHAIARHGRVDVLVNNAGMIQVGPADAMTLEDFRTALATNLWGALHTITAALPFMRARGFGRIANVVSVGGRMAVPHLLPYTVSKFALAGLTKGLRIELARENILVTGVYPGTMRTGGHRHAWIKGDEATEYSLFALGDSLPLVAVPARKVAESLWSAVCNGDPEVHVGWQSQVVARLENLFPNLMAEALAFVNARLPEALSGSQPAVQGRNIRGQVPDVVNRLVPSGTRPVH